MLSLQWEFLSLPQAFSALLMKVWAYAFAYITTFSMGLDPQILCDSGLEISPILDSLSPVCPRVDLKVFRGAEIGRGHTTRDRRMTVHSRQWCIMYGRWTVQWELFLAPC